MKSGLLALGAILFACLGTTSAFTASAWFAGWHEKDFPPSKVPWEKYDNMKYAFALTTDNSSSLDVSNLVGLDEFVTEAKNHSVIPMVSIGGWTGSRFFSTAVGSPTNRTKFVGAVKSLIDKFKLGGVDFDWEYPNGLGVGCNLISPNDTANFLSFLKDLRTVVGPNFTITAAAGITPWLSEDGTPVTNVAAFADVLDYVALMDYDVWGLSDNIVGPNSPLNETCAPVPNASHGSAVSAVRAWTNAGMPPDKIVLGVAYYGRLFRVSNEDAASSNGSLALYPPFDKTNQPLGDDGAPLPDEKDVCGVPVTKPGGIIQFSGMVNKFLSEDGEPLPAIKFAFDDCSKTPFVYDQSNRTMASYDNIKSMSLKSKFINDQKLRGFAAWEVAGDFNSILVDAIRSSF